VEEQALGSAFSRQLSAVSWRRPETVPKGWLKADG